jgi:hypothetical protein
MVPKACNTKILKNCFRFGQDIRLSNISAYAQPAMKSFPRMLSQRLNHFPLAEHTQKFVRRMLSVQ